MAVQQRFSGVLTPVVMPFKESLDVDHARLARQCRWLLTQSVSIAVFGTNSEANSLSVEEKIEILDRLVDAGIDPGRLMPGTGLCAIPDTVRLTAHATALGCGGVLMLPPFYYKGVSDEGLFRSYAEVIERVASDRLQIYLYHIPPVSMVGLSISLVERLITTYPKTVVGIKDSSGDWDNTQKMLEAKWDDFRIFAGSESFLLRNMQLGGAGCISATANVNPAAIYNLFENWQSPDAATTQEKLASLRDGVQSFPVIPALKAIVAHYCADSAWCRVRPPLVELGLARQQKLLSMLDSTGFEMPGLRDVA